MSVTLSANAAEQINKLLTNQPQAVGLRIKITPDGCNGNSYSLDFATSQAANDELIEDQGIKLLVDQASLSLVAGMQIDYTTQGANSHFRFNNPQAKHACGCGESFSV